MTNSDMTRRAALRSGAALALTGALGMTATATAAEAAVETGKWRLYDAREDKERPWRDLPGRLAESDAVFVGEFHDDPETHRAELAILEALHGRVKGRLALAMEMIERDGQGPLDDYLAGRIAEAELPKAVVGWPNYKTDYRPLVEFAREKRIPVYGSNAPQAIVRRVGREGLAAVLPSLPPEQRTLVAAYVQAPEDEYFRRFVDIMTGGGDSHGGMKPDQLKRIYEAQCTRDDTMAETVAKAMEGGRKVLHVNGSFHSDAALGTAARVLWRRPLGTRVSVVKVVPVKGDVRKADPAKDRAEADWLLYVPDLRPERKPA